VNQQKNRQLEEIDRLASIGEVMPEVIGLISTSLSAVVAYAELILSENPESLIKKYSTNIHSAAWGSLNLINGFLSYTNRKEISSGVIDVNAVVFQTMSLFEYQMKANNISFETSFYEKPLLTRMDHYRLQQILFSVVVNALQSLGKLKDEKKISARTGCNENIYIEIYDNGPGIQSIVREKIFEPFYTTKEKGTGLGLSVVKDIISEYGGRIMISHNKGCIFRIELPLYNTGGEFVSYPEQIQTGICPSGKRRVLIVEDNHHTANITKEFLTFLDCEAFIHNDPEKALNFVDENDFDLVLVDYNMPKMNGLSFIEQALSKGKNLCFILISGDSFPDRKASVGDHEVHVLQKPFGLKELEWLIKEVLK
jgi:CheY-like chemotaxis protein